MSVRTVANSRLHPQTDPQAQIFSFEPLHRPARVWTRNFGTDTRAQLFHKAIALQSGSATMHVSRWDVSSSLSPFAQAQHDNFPLTEEASHEAVETALWKRASTNT